VYSEFYCNSICIEVRVSHIFKTLCTILDSVFERVSEIVSIIFFIFWSLNENMLKSVPMHDGFGLLQHSYDMLRTKFLNCI